MPIFDYICKQCGQEFETFVLLDSDRIQCPECGSESVKKVPTSLFSCTGVQLTKRLKMESEEQMVKGQEWMSKQKLRKNRIKIL